MKLSILAFGIARELLGSSKLSLEIKSGTTISDLKNELAARYSQLSQLVQYRVAVNCEYADDDFTLNDGDEVAIIPPVSGG